MFGGNPGELCPPNTSPLPHAGSIATSARVPGSATTAARTARASGDSSGMPSTRVRVTNRADASALSSRKGRGSDGRRSNHDSRGSVTRRDCTTGQAARRRRVLVWRRARFSLYRPSMKRNSADAGIGIMASFGMGRFLAEALTGAFGTLVFKYYETEVGMSGWLVALAIILYSVWNAVNDPLIGWFTARPTPLAARLGRRFPWILVLASQPRRLHPRVRLPAVGGPSASIGLLFVLLLASIFLFDALYSAWELNYQSIFPDRFRGAGERARAAGIGTAVGTVGIAAGFVVPTLFVRYGVPSTYLTSALWFALGGVVVVALLVPGHARDPGHDRALPRGAQERRAPRGQVPAQLRGALANRDFLAFILLYFFYQAAMLSMTASVHYVGDYILGRSTTLIMARHARRRPGGPARLDAPRAQDGEQPGPARRARQSRWPWHAFPWCSRSRTRATSSPWPCGAWPSEGSGCSSPPPWPT